MKYDVIIIGGGAAGLFCAIQAGKRGRAVLVIEHNDRVGRKIEISGGGRCNFTNRNAAPEHYLSQNPRFCISALNRYTPLDFISWVEQHQIPFHEKKLGQLFCDDRSTRITDLLLSECRAAGVGIQVNTELDCIEKHDAFCVRTSQGSYEAHSVVIATGGVSLPKLGSSDIGYRIAKQYGLKLIEYKPGLVPFTLSNEDIQTWGALRGLSLPVQVQCNGAVFEENLLFTHRGLSGPAVLQISNYWRHGDSICMNLFPHQNVAAWLYAAPHKNLLLTTLLSNRFPNRFVQRFSDRYFINKPIKHYTHKEREQIVHTLQHWEIAPVGTEGFRKAEVTLGGVDTLELSPKTLESRKVPGLYFIGEVVDVTGWLGGYNFQWAWSSGYAAGCAV